VDHLAVLIPILGLSAFPVPHAAVEHPLTIPPKFDTSQCATCRSDKTQGKYVRAAMAMGSTTSHSLATTGRVREGKFAVGRSKE
jgi:hypothetical protein